MAVIGSAPGSSLPDAPIEAGRDSCEGCGRGCEIAALCARMTTASMQASSHISARNPVFTRLQLTNDSGRMELAYPMKRVAKRQTAQERETSETNVPKEES